MQQKLTGECYFTESNPVTHNSLREKAAQYPTGKFLRAEDAMVKDVVKVGSSTLVDNAVKMMNKNHIGCLIIEDNGETRGIVTQRDLLKKVLEKAREILENWLFQTS